MKQLLLEMPLLGSSLGAAPGSYTKMVSREMGKAEDEVIGQLAARAKMLERTLRERDDELKEARPRLETLEVELAAAKEESANLAQLNAKLKGHLSGLRHNLLSAEDITP